MKYIVYMATNIANGKRYIGFTSVGLHRRRQSHFNKAESDIRSNGHFHRAIRKHGRDSFSWEIVASFDTAAEALCEEVRLISELKPEYNILLGGESGQLGVPSKMRMPVTCLTDGIMHVSATHASKAYGLGVVAVSDVCRGKYRSANGLHFIWGDIEYSENEREHLIRMLEDAHALRRKRVSRNKNHVGIVSGKDVLGRSAAGPAKNAKPVECLEDGKEYPSASAAARHYNVAKSAVIEMCLGKNNRASVGGLRFKYKEPA